MSAMRTNENVVILGGGVAGKLIAKILCEHYSKVSLVTGGREEVFQSGQLHVLLAGGWEIMESHFPETIAQLEKVCPRVDWGFDSFWVSPVGIMPKLESGVVTHTCSRSLLDKLMGEEISGLPIEVVNEKVTAIDLSSTKEKVTTVQTGSGEIKADIVIDAMGRTSPMLKWLNELIGLKLSQKRMDTELRYSTVTAEFAEGVEAQQAYYQIDPQTEGCGGVILPVEDGKVIASYIYMEREPETLWQGIGDDRFTKIAASLENVSPVRKISKLHNIWHQIEKASNMPTNLFMVGDSICQFNPVFGQGMTQALRSGLILCEQLVEGKVSSHVFHKRQAVDLRFPWLMATLDPYSPKVKLNCSQRMMRWWVYKQMKLAKKNQSFQRRLIEVLHMKSEPTCLYRMKYIISTFLS